MFKILLALIISCCTMISIAGAEVRVDRNVRVAGTRQGDVLIVTGRDILRTRRAVVRDQNGVLRNVVFQDIRNVGLTQRVVIRVGNTGVFIVRNVIVRDRRVGAALDRNVRVLNGNFIGGLVVTFLF